MRAGRRLIAAGVLLAPKRHDRGGWPYGLAGGIEAVLRVHEHSLTWGTAGILEDTLTGGLSLVSFPSNSLSTCTGAGEFGLQH